MKTVGHGGFFRGTPASEKLNGVDEHQPMPTKNESPAIQDLVVADVREFPDSRLLPFPACARALVVADIEARKLVGLQRYGTLLQAFNGRDALMDAYQEALDLCQYLRQCMAEGAWVNITYETAIRMALHIRTLIEDRANETARLTALGDPARGD